MRLIFLLLLALPAAACDRQIPPGQQGEALQTGKLDRGQQGKLAPATVFRDPDGGDISLADFRGVPVLVNLWATWCAPCVKELPTLDQLAKSHDVDGQLGVIAVSQDRAPQGSVKAFLAQHRIMALGAYHDPDMALSGALGTQILPTSILFDAEGREVWRYVGDLDWTSKEAEKLLAAR